MDQATSGKCPTCGDKKHVLTDTGLARCPECFIPSKVARALKRHNLPTKWAKFNLALLAELLPAEDPVLARFHGLVSGSYRSIHFFGEPSLDKQGIIAFTVSILLAKFNDVTIYDSEELVRNSFEDPKHRAPFHLAKNAVIFSLGNESAPKHGARFFRSVVEHCSNRNLPIALFTDGSPAAMSGRYPDFMSLYKLARFVSFQVPEIHCEV